MGRALTGSVPPPALGNLELMKAREREKEGGRGGEEEGERGMDMRNNVGKSKKDWPIIITPTVVGVYRDLPGSSALNLYI